jgi:indolepyruvate ferredoxin oxidoreductase alpha subunit
MATNRIAQLIDAADGQRVVLQGNIAFAVGAVRGGIHAADGYPGTPSTEVIDKALRHVQERIKVGWSVNEANAVAVGLGVTMVGQDAVVTMKIPGLYQAADVVATVAGYTARRGGLVLYVASDFVPSSTQYVFDPRYFLKSCFVPVLEPRNHQEMHDIGPLAASLARAHNTLVVVLANGLICHSEGLVTLGTTRVQGEDPGVDFTRFMNLPEIARRNYESIVTGRMEGLTRFAETTGLNRLEWNERSLGVIVHGVTELYLREVWDSLPVKPSVLSLGMTFPVPAAKVREFAQGLTGAPLVLGDGLRFVQEELLSQGIAVKGKELFDPRTEWTPEAVAERLGAVHGRAASPQRAAPVFRPPGICAGCPYRAFGLVVDKLRKKRKLVASFGDIGCNTLLYFLRAVDTCTCMGAADSKRQGVVLADPSLAGKVISVLGDSTECHSGLDSTRNAVFKDLPGVKVVLDNSTTAMTGGQPAPTSPANLQGHPNRFDLVAALRAEGASVQLVDAFCMEAIEQALTSSLQKAEQGAFTVLVLRGACMQELPADQKTARYEIDKDKCKRCDLCLVCPGLEKNADGYPQYTHLCTSCGGNSPICVQRCNLDGIVLQGPQQQRPVAAAVALPEPEPLDGPRQQLPASIRVATRGVGGQGNLFLGKILSSVALLAGFRNVVKGETHGMAQLGGAVLSTFSCGQVHSPVLAPGSVDILVAMEESEVLRPGFLQLLREDGVVLLNRLRLIPAGTREQDYPSPAAIRAALQGLRVVEFDALAQARATGDEQGRCQNVVALGVLSTLPPLSVIPAALWRQALAEASPGTLMKRANLAAFEQGRKALA